MPIFIESQAELSNLNGGTTLQFLKISSIFFQNKEKGVETVTNEAHEIKKH